MSQMTIERLHDLLDARPEKATLGWPGTCHDCGCEMEVTATCLDDGIHICGGSVYEPAKDQFFLKCETCFKTEPVLRNFQGCEVYSRVVGYLRPVGQWNDAKAQEYGDRQLYDQSV